MMDTTFQLPDFLAENPEVWFVQCESAFQVNGITDSLMKYHHVVLKLPPVAVAAKVLAIIRIPPETEPYEKLRRAVLRCLTGTDPVGEIKREDTVGTVGVVDIILSDEEEVITPDTNPLALRVGPAWNVTEDEFGYNAMGEEDNNNNINNNIVLVSDDDIAEEEEDIKMQIPGLVALQPPAPPVVLATRKPGPKSSKRMMFNCDLCVDGEVFTAVTAAHLEHHQRSVHLKKAKKAVVNNRHNRPLTLPTVGASNHLSPPGSSISFACDTCDADSFSDKKQLEEHLQNAHPGRKRVKCFWCHKPQLTRQLLRRHMKRCGKREKKNQVHSEADDENDVEEEEEEEEVETTSTTVASSSAATVNIREKREKGKYKCNLCPRTYYTENHLLIHLKNTHEKAVAEEEDAEAEVDTTDAGMEKDMGKKPAGSSKEGKKCSYCEKVFKSGLNRHINTIHLQIKNFVCTECPSKFAFQYQLTKHAKAHE